MGTRRTTEQLTMAVQAVVNETGMEQAAGDIGNTERVTEICDADYRSFTTPCEALDETGTANR